MVLFPGEMVMKDGGGRFSGIDYREEQPCYLRQNRTLNHVTFRW